MSPFISIFSTNILLLTNEQKEAIVIEMLKAKRPIRDIAKEAHKSFTDIGEIKRRELGESASYIKKKKVSKVSQALELFSKKKTPIDVTIELDLDPKDVEKIYLNYLGLNGLHQLVKIYQELGNYLLDFISFYWSFREYGIDNKKIKQILDISNRLISFNLEIKTSQIDNRYLIIYNNIPYKDRYRKGLVLDWPKYDNGNCLKSLQQEEHEIENSVNCF